MQTMRICPGCGKEFEAKTRHHKWCSDKCRLKQYHPVRVAVCEVCGKEFETNKSGKAKYCPTGDCRKIGYARSMEKFQQRNPNYNHHRKTTKGKGNGWFCRRCGRELTEGRRFYCEPCENYIFRCTGDRDIPRCDGEYIYYDALNWDWTQ